MHSRLSAERSYHGDEAHLEARLRDRYFEPGFESSLSILRREGIKDVDEIDIEAY